MFTQNVYGMPRRCPNRMCKAEFTRECHRGYLRKSEMEVIAVMKCAKCRDQWGVVQMVTDAHDYKERLPRAEPATPPVVGEPITIAEMTKIRKKLEDNTSLQELIDEMESASSGD